MNQLKQWLWEQIQLDLSDLKFWKRFSNRDNSDIKERVNRSAKLVDAIERRERRQ